MEVKRSSGSPCIFFLVQMSEHGRFALYSYGGQRDGNSRHVFTENLMYGGRHTNIPCPIEFSALRLFLATAAKACKSVQCWPLFLSVISNKRNGMRASLLISDQ